MVREPLTLRRELAWSKMWTLLRSTAARTYEALLEGVEHALRAISGSDAAAFIRACGYQA